MSRESLIIISRLIVVAVFIISLLAMALGNFFVTLIAVSGGLIVWLLYLLAAGLGIGQGETETGTTLGKSLSKVVAGLGGVLAVSAFITYGVEQTIWGGYSFDLMGLALALAILWVTIMPLVLMQLMGKPHVPTAFETERPAAALPEEAQPPTATAIPDQQIYYGSPYPQEPDAYGQGEILEYGEEDEEWEGAEEETDEDDYEDEEGYEYEDEDEDEDEDEEDEDEDEDIR